MSSQTKGVHVSATDFAKLFQATQAFERMLKNAREYQIDLGIPQQKLRYVEGQILGTVSHIVRKNKVSLEISLENTPAQAKANLIVRPITVNTGIILSYMAKPTEPRIWEIVRQPGDQPFFVSMLTEELHLPQETILNDNQVSGAMLGLLSWFSRHS